MKLTSPLASQIEDNRSGYLHNLCIHSQQVVSAGIVHGNKIQVVVGRDDRGKIISDADGLATNGYKVYLAVTVADCLPIYIYDPMQKVVGMVHAGWRSLEKGIIESTVGSFIKAYRSKPGDILVGIGPAIGSCHYEVGKEVIDLLEKRMPSASVNFYNFNKGKYFLDLKEIAKQQLLHAGVVEKHIEIHPDCTYCEKETYYSYRRDKPKKVQAMLAVIGMR